MLDNICSKKIAYLIGFLAGDGMYCDGFGKRKDRMAVTTTDEDVVNWINSNIEEFTMHNPKLNNNEAAGIYARLPSYQKTFAVQHSEFFNKYGVLCKKTDRTIQNISKKDMKYFLLGFLDADGCLSFTQRKDRDRVVARVSFTHPSTKLLEKVQTFLCDNLGIASSIKPKGQERCFVLSFSKITSVLKFCEWIYSDKNDIVLKRKHSNYLELLNIIAQKEDTGCCYPREFIETSEYITIVSSVSKFMFIVDSVEYPSAVMVANKYGVGNKTVHQRCRQGDMGWGRRPKTEQEVEEYSAQVKRRIKKLYSEWRITN